MKYRVKYITRRMKEKSALTSEEAYTLFKSWWLVMNIKKNDAFYADRINLRKLFDKLGVIYVKTHKSYFPKFNKKYRSMLTNLTYQTYEDHRLLVLPPLNLCKKTSISSITKLLKQDIDAKKIFGPFLPESLKPLYTIPLKNGSLKKILQSGKSYMRRKILSPKVHAFRIQIMCDPKLPSDCVILPVVFANYLQVFEFEEVHPNSYDFYDMSKFYTLRSDLSLLLKRDPVIHAASIMCPPKFAFSSHDVLYIPSQIMEVMHADIDGDAFILYVIRSSLAAVELKLFLSQQNNIALANGTTRLNCSSAHILYMYKRTLPTTHRYFGLFEFVRKYVRQSYIQNTDYMQSFEKLKKYHPDLSYKDIDPTAKILKQFFYMLCILHGDNEAYLVINELNFLVYELSIGVRNALYDPNLPMCYLFSKSLLCPNLRAVILSEAKGSIDHYLLMLERKMKADTYLEFKTQLAQPEQTTDSTDVCLDIEEFVKTITQMAVSSELVPRHGYEIYKNSNDWSNLQIIDGKMYYCDICMGSVEYFFSSPYIFSPVFIKYCLEYASADPCK